MDASTRVLQVQAIPFRVHDFMTTEVTRAMICIGIEGRLQGQYPSIHEVELVFPNVVELKPWSLVEDSKTFGIWLYKYTNRKQAERDLSESKEDKSAWNQ